MISNTHSLSGTDTPSTRRWSIWRGWGTPQVCSLSSSLHLSLLEETRRFHTAMTTYTTARFFKTLRSSSSSMTDISPTTRGVGLPFQRARRWCSNSAPRITRCCRGAPATQAATRARILLRSSSLSLLEEVTARSRTSWSIRMRAFSSRSCASGTCTVSGNSRNEWPPIWKRKKGCRHPNPRKKRSLLVVSRPMTLSAVRSTSRSKTSHLTRPKSIIRQS